MIGNLQVLPPTGGVREGPLLPLRGELERGRGLKKAQAQSLVLRSN